MSDPQLQEKCAGCSRKYSNTADGIFVQLHGCHHKVCRECADMGRPCSIYHAPNVRMYDEKLTREFRKVNLQPTAPPVPTIRRSAPTIHEPTRAVQPLLTTGGQTLTPLSLRPAPVDVLICCTCSKEISGIASICTTCLHNKYRDWTGIAEKTIETEAMCADCRLDHEENHSFRKLAELKNELNSKNYQNDVAKKLDLSIKTVANFAKIDQPKMELLKESLFSTVAALQNSDTSAIAEIEKHLQDALQAHDEASNKFFSIHHEFSLEIDRINSSLEKYSSISEKPKKAKKSIAPPQPNNNISIEIPLAEAEVKGYEKPEPEHKKEQSSVILPPAPSPSIFPILRRTPTAPSSYSSCHSMPEVTTKKMGTQLPAPYPHATSTSPSLVSRPLSPPPSYSSTTAPEATKKKYPFYILANTNDLRSVSINECAKVCLQNVSQKLIQFQCIGSMSNFVVNPTSATMAPQQTIILSCLRITNNPKLAKKMFIHCHPQEDETSVHKIPLQLE